MRRCALLLIYPFRQMSHEVEVMKVEMAKVMAMANLVDASNKQVHFYLALLPMHCNAVHLS